VIRNHQRYRQTDRQTDGQTDVKRSHYRYIAKACSGKNTGRKYLFAPSKFQQFLSTSMPIMRLRPGILPGPRWGSLQRSPDPLAHGRALADPPPKSHFLLVRDLGWAAVTWRYWR